VLLVVGRVSDAFGGKKKRNVRRTPKLITFRLRNHPRSAALSIIQGQKTSKPSTRLCLCILPQSATQKPRTITPIQRLHSFCARVFQGVQKGYIKTSVTPSKLFLPPHCLFMLHRPPAVYWIHSVVSSSFASRGTSNRQSNSCCGESFAHALCARFSLHLAFVCVAFISMCCFPAHSMYGFRTPPTMPIPSARKPSGSFALITLTGGNKGLSALTCAASLAACSMASISSLQAA
jgi:hypothetical protein